MPKTVVGIWIYLCGVIAAVATGGLLSQVLSVFPADQIEAYGPVVPAVARLWSTWLPYAPAVLWIGAAASFAAGLCLWRSRRLLEERLFLAVAIATLNLFLSVFLTSALLVAYFYLPKVANGS